ncbi:copper chaperone PCu(A)C [Rhizobacter sp. J219]|uniref:copper chaperone PCu(A)C n=1 Tax=Rhizobacter sp. J219 TaxID=2898430 RepID=UPI0021518EEC|nr:copper chaperone PCu(A)C [Rhizobacter sp. J219]MCR5885148.1 copper chaperone PCu(A)C [Rhizobacter sp. J219]
MTFTRRLLAALSLSAFVLAAHAHSFKLGELTIGHPYARATVPGQPAGGAYLSVSNAGTTGDKLVSASADVSKSVELHEMKMDGDVMRMREVTAVEVPAGKAVELKPGGLHIMLMGLKAPLKQGDKFPLKLKFEKAGEVTVTVNVEGPGASHDMKH